MIPGVEDQWAVKQHDGTPGRPLITPQQLRDQLLVIREKAAVVVLLVDLLDASGTFLSKLRSLTGRNPIVLVGTKARRLVSALQTHSCELHSSFVSCMLPSVAAHLQSTGSLHMKSGHRNLKLDRYALRWKQLEIHRKHIRIWLLLFKYYPVPQLLSND